MSSDSTSIQQWAGRQREEQDVIAPAALRAMAAMLDADPGAVTDTHTLPALWHWLFFNTPVPRSLLGMDGHPRTGDFLPPAGDRRRMWAGGRLRFLQPLQAGQSVRRVSTIKRVETKQGRSGNLLFVCIEHLIFNHAGLAIEEEQDLVYREPAGTGVSTRPSEAVSGEKRPADFSTMFRADAVLLFRYSALTFNGHRIHYDRAYATGVEGYPGLVVHGPLLATLLLRLLSESLPDAAVEQFEFRARQPVFDGEEIRLCGRQSGPDSCHLWVEKFSGELCMEAEARLASAGAAA